MSLGLYLRAKLRSSWLDPEDGLGRIAQWLQGSFADMYPDIRLEPALELPTLYCRLHPAGEEVEFQLADRDHVVFSANTTTVGPGYHIFLAELLKKWAIDLEADWDPEDDPQSESSNYFDETGYFSTGNQELLIEEMTSWLSALTKTFFDGSMDSESRGIALCMAMNPRFEADEAALTSLGPRNRAWLSETAQDGRRGTDFFAWFSAAKDAEYYLRRALVHMWTNERWRPPASESEHRVLLEVSECLRRAFALDSSLPYPWAEWAEVQELLGRDRREREWMNPRKQSEPKIGYRRGNVTVSLPGGWSMKIPGSFSDFESDDEGDHSAFDPPREIWFTAYHSSTGASLSSFDTMKGKLKRNRPEHMFEKDHCVSEARVNSKKRDTGEKYYVLNSSTFAPGKRAVCTILFSDPDHKDWALDTWRSITPPDSSGAG
jgi:hypothetical protein